MITVSIVIQSESDITVLQTIQKYRVNLKSYIYVGNKIISNNIIRMKAISSRVNKAKNIKL